MTLKTLKDIEEECKYKVSDGFELLKIIKQEAIKWVKQKDWTDVGFETHNEFEVIDNFIKHFFNITEEDLQ